VCACVCVCPFLTLSPSFSLSLPAVSSLCFPVSLSISPLLSLSLSLVPSLFARACIYFYAKMLCPAYILLVIACRMSCVCLCTVRQHPYMPHHTYERVQTYTLIFHSSRNISPKHRGATGPTGFQGADGPVGYTGPRGPTGPTGWRQSERDNEEKWEKIQKGEREREGGKEKKSNLLHFLDTHTDNECVNIQP